MPDEKLAVVKQLKEEGEVAAMMGDGINDAPALAIVDLGMGGSLTKPLGWWSR